MTESNPYSPPASHVGQPAAPARVARERNDSPSFFVRCWEGSARLWQAYWLLGVAGKVGLLLLISVLMVVLVPARLDGSPGPALAFLAIPWLVYVLYVLFAWICIWRCAHNTDNPVWGGLARVSVVFAALSIVVALTRGFLPGG